MSMPANLSRSTPLDSDNAHGRRRRHRRKVRISYIDQLYTAESSDEDAASAYEESEDSGSPIYDSDCHIEAKIAFESESSTHDAVLSSEEDAGKIGSGISGIPVEKPHIESASILSKKSKCRGVDTSLPPLSNIKDIFKDITRMALDKGLQIPLDALDGRELRVATMCSGTESPVLALELVAEALVHLGKSLRLRHVFSAEIVPKKQAFIERNFHPPIIFRDIRELAGEDAFGAGAYVKMMSGIVPSSTDRTLTNPRTNVYGAKVQIPGDVDLLVAGFSCVDFSSLNNKGKLLNEKGESRDTLEAILKYAERWAPKVIVLENVYGAPWTDCVSRANKVGYAAEFVRVDTKDYWLPHTRTRGYMVCINQEQFPATGAVTAALQQWKGLMMSFKRRASAPVSDFLLPAADHRVQHFNAVLATQYRQDTRERTVNWDACRARHRRERNRCRLGDSRPITQWVDGGSCMAFEHAHKMWLSKQVERVWDCIEIRFLRAAQDQSGKMPGYDPMFKTSIMELSQNVDRFEGETPFGICSCITPSGIFYLTDRGGPLTPYESLALQGLPLDRISFTIETMRDLQDLAGNAMSSTVVGVAQLAALIVAAPMLRQCTVLPNSITPTVPPSPPASEGAGCLEPMERLCLNSEKALCSELCKDALGSVRLCHCEGQSAQTVKEILACGECGHTVCTHCRGKPLHAYEAAPSTRTMTAQEFELRWKHILPSRLRFVQLPDLRILGNGRAPDGAFSEAYFEHVMPALGEQFNFHCFQRSLQWTVYYESPLASLRLHIGQQAEWRLFIKPPAHLPANDPHRESFNLPVARAKLPEHLDLGDGNDCCWALCWQWFIPLKRKVPVFVEQLTSDVDPSWRAHYGLADYLEETVPQQLRISVTPDSVYDLPEDVSGTYKHLPVCGTASSALYRREPANFAGDTDAEEAGGALYLFLDPSRLGAVDKDAFVFSRNHERLGYNEQRDVVARLDSSFRPWNRHSFQTNGVFAGYWLADEVSERTRLCAPGKPLVVKRPPTGDRSWGTNMPQSCSYHLAILSMEFALEFQGDGPKSLCFDERNGLSFMREFSWALATNAHLPDLKEWHSLNVAVANKYCDTCGPALPSVRWIQSSVQRGKKVKATFVAQEDPEEAAWYEQRMKNRPSVLHLTAEIDEPDSAGAASTCRLQIGLNPVTLAHAALSRLRLLPGKAKLSWNLTTEYVASAAPHLESFRLLSNLQDAETHEPAEFRLTLRPSQRRSLCWMMQQERGRSFTLQEVAETVVEPMRWKVEAKAQLDTTIHGGVIADQVSYGKTITSLALVHAGFCESRCSPGCNDGLIPLKATLILVPHNLVGQWMHESERCLPNEDYNRCNMLKIKTLGDLAKLTISDFQKAKIVVAPYSLLGKDAYLKQLAWITAVPEASLSERRQFESWFKYCLDRMPRMNERLKELGISSFGRFRGHELSRTESHKDFTGIVPSKRTKGAKYKGLDELQPVNKPTAKKVDTEALERPVSYPQQDDWPEFPFPVLHQFQFNRKIIDEYHYLRDEAYIGAKCVSADKTWIISGTPPLNDFADVKRTAAFLGVGLGIDADAPGVMTQENSRLLRKEKTQVEMFQAFNQRYSPGWHERRHRHAQGFLDAFARQNPADIGDIKCHESLRSVPLALDHQAIYEEVSLRFKGRNMAMVGVAASETGDRAKELRKSMQGVDTAEEALVRCLSARILDAQGSDRACALLVTRREKQLRDKRRELHKVIAQAPRDDASWVRACTAQTSSSSEDSGLIESLADMEVTAAKGGGSTGAVKDVARLARQELSMRRSLQYARSVCEIHQAGEHGKCVGCHCGGDSLHEAVASSTSVIVGCGHIVCKHCLQHCLAKEQCSVSGCQMEVRDYSVLAAARLGRCADVEAAAESFGSKLAAVVRLLKSIPAEEQAIIFVQSYHVMDIVDRALWSSDIPAFAIDRDSDSASDKIDAFVNNKRYTDGGESTVNADFGKVLILNLGDESASGMNLVNANHVIFLSPLLTSTDQKYQAAMVQSIGRARRFGQKRPVHVYRFMAPHTVDVDILEQREVRSTALRADDGDMAVLFEAGKQGYERVQVVEEERGTLAAVPKSWVQDRDRACRHGLVLKRAESGAVERFTSLNRFSEVYCQG